MIAGLLGRRRTGKSTLALALSLLRNKTVIIWDPNNQYRNFDALSVAGIERHLLDESEQESPSRVPFIARHVPPADSHHESFSRLTDMLWGWEEYSIIVDEASTLQSPAIIHPNLARLLRQAPASVDIILASHRLTDFHRLPRSLFTDVFIFRTNQVDDIDKLAREFDDSLRGVLPRLEDYQVAHWWTRAGGKIVITEWASEDARAAWHVRIGHKETSADFRQK